jgi:hypothetical protein
MALARGDLNGVRAWSILRRRTRREAGAITVVAVMNEEAWWLGVPTAAFNNLLCRPLGGRMRRHMHVENLPAGVMDDEEDVECPKEDRLAQSTAPQNGSVAQFVGPGRLC